MTATAANFDAGKFRKVAALMTGGATEGERAAAKARAEAIAGRAGMTLKQAMAKVDDKPAAPSWTDAFADIFKDAHDAARVRDAARRSDALKRYGSVKAVFDASPWEKALREAVAGFSVQMPCMDPAGVTRTYTAVLDGVMGKLDTKFTRRVMEAVRNAYQFPATIAEGIEEVRRWDELRRDRSAFVKYEHDHDMEVEARLKALEDFLNHHPAETWDDIDARFDWDLYSWGRQWITPEEHTREDEFSPRIRADIAIMRAKAEVGDIGRNPYDDESRRENIRRNSSHVAPDANTAPAYRTNADRKAAVLAALHDNPGLSDRHIAALAGVSHQTVSNWRKRLHQQAA